MTSTGAGPEGHTNGMAFLLSFVTILVCEIGDKTFFLAMVMAMKYNQMVVFVGSYGALAVMTVLSTIFGAFITVLIQSKLITGVIVAALFFFFGGKMIHEAYNHPDSEEENEELKEVMEELKEMEEKIEDRLSGTQGLRPVGNEGVVTSPGKPKRGTGAMMIPSQIILTQAFTMTFLAEWGDRSQIATISLAVSDNAVMVTLGALLGHFLCTGAAVKLGEWISHRVKEKTILYVGGIVFILSGLITLIGVLKGS